MVDGQNGGKVNIQEYLQEAFLAAVEKLNEAVGDLDGVLGIEVSRYFSLWFGTDPIAHERTPCRIYRITHASRMGKSPIVIDSVIQRTDK